MTCRPFDAGWSYDLDGRRTYHGFACLPGTGDRAWLVGRDGGEIRTVQHGPFGFWHCDCPGWKFCRKCPHVVAVMAFETD